MGVRSGLAALPLLYMHCIHAHPSIQVGGPEDSWSALSIVKWNAAGKSWIVLPVPAQSQNISFDALQEKLGESVFCMQKCSGSTSSLGPLWKSEVFLLVRADSNYVCWTLTCYDTIQLPVFLSRILLWWLHYVTGRLGPFSHFHSYA